MSVTIIKDVKLINELQNFDVALIPSGIYCSLGDGLQRDIALRYPYADTLNKATKYGDRSKLGNILTCKEEGKPIICLMYFIFPFGKKGKGDRDWLDYDSLGKCISYANEEFKGLKCACPMLGCSRFDGNGDKDKVISLLKEKANDLDLTIFDYFEESRDEKIVKRLKKESAVKQIDRGLYYKMVKDRKEKAEELFKINGHARY